MNKVDLIIGGESYEIAPSFAFLNRIKKTLNTGSLLEIQLLIARLDYTVVASVLHSALIANGVKKFTLDQVGEKLMTGELDYYDDDGENLGGQGAALEILNAVTEALKPKGADTEKN